MLSENMNANELRIGNYVYAHGGNDATFHRKGQPRFLAVISSLSSACIMWDVIEGKLPDYYHQSFEPIPLAEEWLEKFCNESVFTSDPQEGDASKAYWIGDLIVHQANENVDEFVVYLMDAHYRDREFDLKLKYVHQLQNLYFSLTGNELTLKP